MGGVRILSILGGAMNVFSLKRMSTSESRIIERYRNTRPRKIAGNLKISNCSDKKAGRFAGVIAVMVITVWVLAVLSFLEMIPVAFGWASLGLFVLTNMTLLVGEMVIHREVPGRNKILGVLWLPAIAALGTVALMALLR